MKRTIILLASLAATSLAVAQTESEEVASPLLTGTLKTVKITTGSAKLKNGTEGLGFYAQSTSVTHNANTAYLAEKRTLLIDLSSLDNPTGINEIKKEELRKKNDASVYNLAGQMVNGKWLNGKCKGIYIIGNKKVLVK